MQAEIMEIINKYPNKERADLIPILQDIQNKFGYLSQENLISIGKYLNLSTSKICGVATFYNQFKFEAPGKHHIQVCRGTACHVKGSAKLLDIIEKITDCKAGHSSKNGLFSIDTVACIGVCGLAPVITVDGEFIGKAKSKTIKKIVKNIKKEAKNV